ncbi:MAG: LacI family DNA-binding transcriptional regulator [candidate division KSB1 bacterium]|nr:LacI family DNA-binding transcriptional regulator [candidate division KSB1 bacterium]
MKVPITINDIARMGNCSKATVSAVLNNRPGISEPTRKRIMDLVKKYNYKPSQLARSLFTHKTQTIGLVIKEIDNPFFAKLMRGVYQICSERNYTVLLGSSELSSVHQSESIDALVRQQVEGIIISPLFGDDVNNELILDIHNDGYPVVLLNDIGLSGVPSVGIDNRKAAYQAVNYLLGKGHSRIVFLSGPDHSINAAERIKGYKQALEEARTEWQSEDVIPTGSTIEEGYKVGKRIFNQPVPYTAALCFNDMVAVGLSNALVEHNIKIPDDLSIVGFDNIKFCNSMRVPLTSVEVPAFKIGTTAAQVLFDSFDASSEIQQRYVVEAKLVERASVKSIQ